MKPIAYTIGEPAGIGMDIFLTLAKTENLNDVCIIGDREALSCRAQKLGVSVPKGIDIVHVPLAEPDVIGRPVIKNAKAVLSILDRAIDGCVDGEFSAMVTGPLHKGIINDAGVRFSGHTEYLAERTNSALPVMLLASSTLRVALVTTHLPLRAVADAITTELITQVCEIVDHDFRTKYGLSEPRILVCGLNPHAGEGGHMGTEEIEIIEPALERLRLEGMNIVGPLPADTLFTTKYLDKADVVIAMYHDQGLPVLKAQTFGEAANITLGLPIIRTSVDHGTAFDLAGTGCIDTGSLMTAINVARDMAKST